MSFAKVRFLIFIVSLFGLVSPAFAITSPSISANALFLYRNSNFHTGDTNAAVLDENPNGFDVEETEIQIFADVDPYTRLNLLFTIAPSYSTDGTTVSESYGIEPEEGFVESNVIPSLTLKFGKFKAFVGKHNMLHSHAYPFIEGPLANGVLLGGEGLNDTGFSAAYLIPTFWYNELTFQFLRGKGDNDEFNSPSPSDNAALVHWKNLFDLTDSLTLEAGATFAEGKNSFRGDTNLYGADLTLKWRPSEGGRYQSVIWATEYLGRNRSQPAVTEEKGQGLTSWVQYQFAERWAALYRYDTVSIDHSLDILNLPNDTLVRHSLALVYNPSEFSAFKIEYDQKTGAPEVKNQDTEKVVMLQANLTIGAHPAHSY